jgi:hypothetical protein
MWFSVLTKFRLVPTHVILHILRVFLEDLNGANVDSLAALLEACGRYLLRGSETGEKTAAMVGQLFPCAVVKLTHPPVGAHETKAKPAAL